MYVVLGRLQAGRAEVTTDRYGELVLTLPPQLLDEQLVAAINEQVESMTTRDALMRELLEHPLTYDAAARALGVSRRWLERKVASDPTFPHTKIAGHVMFLVRHITEIRARFEHGEIRYAKHGGRPRRQPPPAPPAVPVRRRNPLVRRPGLDPRGVRQ